VHASASGDVVGLYPTSFPHAPQVPGAYTVSRVSVRVARRLRVQPERQARVGMPQPRLRRLHVHALKDERRRSSAPKVMERAGSADCSESFLLLASYCVRYARQRRRTDALPLKSSGAFEFPKRLELREIVCDGCELPVAPVVCDRAQLKAHSVSAGELSCRVECAHSIDKLVLVDHHAPRVARLGHA
jgi:hypothetical protein